MTHPNCHPSVAMKDVCRAARNAARRNNDWFDRWGNVVHGLNGYRPRKVCEFHVTFYGKSRRLQLTSGGVLLIEISDGFIPLDLVDLNEYQLDQIENALETIGR